MSELNLILHRFKQFFITENNKPTKKGIAVVIAALLYSAVLGSNKEEVKPVEPKVQNIPIVSNPSVEKPKEILEATSSPIVKDITLYKYCSDQEAPCNTITATIADNKTIKGSYIAKDGTEVSILVNLDSNNKVTGQITHKYKVASLGAIIKDICADEFICTWEKVGTEYKLFNTDIKPSEGAAYNFEGNKGFKAYSFSLVTETSQPKKEVKPKVVSAALPPNAITGVTVDIKDNSTCLNIRKSPNGNSLIIYRYPIGNKTIEAWLNSN